MAGEIPTKPSNENQISISKKDLDLRILGLTEEQRSFYFNRLLQKQIELMPEKKNVSLEDRYGLLNDAINERIAVEKSETEESKTEESTIKENPYGIEDLEKFHKGGQESLDSRPDIYELD